MGRIRNTISGIITIIVVLFMITQASEIGVPWPFTIIAIVIVILIIFSLIRTWLRG